MGHNNKNNSDNAAPTTRTKSCRRRSVTKTKQNVSELSVLGTLLFSGPTARVSCRCREESSSRRHCIYPMTRPMSLTALCIQSFPFALLKSLSLGINSGVEKRRKIPVKTKTKTERERTEQKAVEDV